MRAPEAGERSYQMVVADVDGTVLDSTGTLRPRVALAIEAAQRAGVVFSFATGRRYMSMHAVLRQLAWIEGADGGGILHPAPPPLVLHTGALVASADGVEIYHRYPLPLDDARLAVRLLLDMGLMPIIYEDRLHDQHLVAGPPALDSPGAAKYLGANAETVVRRPLEALVPEEPPMQLAVLGDRKPIEVAAARLEGANCRSLIAYSVNLHCYFMEVLHRDTNKWRGTLRLAQHLRIDPHRVVCIGDNANDVEMLAEAGCGVAVANAAPIALPHARRLAPSNDEDGVAVVLEQVIAGEEPGVPNPNFRHEHVMGHQ